MKPMAVPRMYQKTIDPNRCFKREFRPLSYQATKAECDNARAQVEDCPSMDLEKEYYNYLEVTLVSTRPIDNQGNTAVYRCSTPGIWSDSLGEYPYTGTGTCYVLGHVFTGKDPLECEEAAAAAAAVP